MPSAPTAASAFGHTSEGTAVGSGVLAGFTRIRETAVSVGRDGYRVSA